MRRLNLAINDITCIHCVKRVGVALRRVSGVSNASVNLPEKVAAADANAHVLVKAIREEGFVLVASKTRMVVKGMIYAFCVSQIRAALKKASGTLVQVLSVFKWLAWWRSLPELVKNFFYGVYAWILFVPTHNLFTKHWGTRT